ncbi:MAG: glycyl-tRNA synthetase [Parcubacteria group bacterium Gr01-1014_48]|nr:MAG: glycyl-tRNA synthetase [Parcubacteria group bacterium Greene0416_14]TSC73785.1 MAG: glycyl-tRNA synthetase [Parcubacteria group bacterium Gr01-1014_48]TSD00652.1 MAG: glycyl-tRNA synthetase [Parcubacteria group bacterium Greene1014_15]TSD08088.1 MAG: glycyl-tRNA synthetase [Parcubacteria group bacterium Greene0714_4]
MTKEREISLLERVVSLCKRRGFVYQGSEIYGGLAGTWDYGPMGVRLKNTITKLWWKTFVDDRSDMYGIDAAILMNANVWKAVGHVEGFTDPLIECTKCKHRFRADHIRERAEKKMCPTCGGALGDPRQFNMMFETNVGAVRDSSSIAYLRPETAQGIFVNFKNIVDSFHPKLPFGIAQIGKAFRNEITPRDFLFRTREFEQMEIEYFVKENEWEQYFELWRKHVRDWTKSIGLAAKNVHELEVETGDRAHYSKRTIDFEYSFPFGRKELYGLAYRTDFDVRSHAAASSVDLNYQDLDTGERFMPHVIEPSFGLDRTILAVLLESYAEDELGSETRVYLKLPAHLAPVSVAVFPLLKNKPDLVKKARAVFDSLRKQDFAAAFDDNGNIGKRYRRQDEIGTPLCVTVDFTTLEDDTVTVRDRDSGKQERVKLDELTLYIEERIVPA